MSKSNVKASVVDNALTVSFLSGKEPRVWRVDMGKFISTALEVKESQDKFVLLMKTGAGPAEEVGSFSDKKRALEVLQAVTDALMQGNTAPPPPAKTGGFFKKLFKFLLLVALLVLLFVMWSNPRMSGNMVNEVMHPPAPTAPKTGVPVPADELFGK